MIKLYNDIVGIRPIFESDTFGSSNLIKPDIAKKRVKQGIVQYIGPKVKNIKVGDYVFFSGYSGQSFKLEGEGNLILISEDGIVCALHSTKLETLEIPGVYFKDNHGEYWTATYEQVMQLISMAISESHYFPLEAHEFLDEHYEGNVDVSFIKVEGDKE